MQTTKKAWTKGEVDAFSEWDQKRGKGELGAPMHFNNVDELMNWLHAEK